MFIHSSRHLLTRTWVSWVRRWFSPFFVHSFKISNVFDRYSSQPRKIWEMVSGQVVSVILALFAAATNARSLGFSAGFSSGMVLQRGPSKSAVYGYGGAGKVIVYIDGVDGSGVKTSYNVSTNANRFVHCILCKHCLHTFVYFFALRVQPLLVHYATTTRFAALVSGRCSSVHL